MRFRFMRTKGIEFQQRFLGLTRFISRTAVFEPPTDFGDALKMLSIFNLRFGHGLVGLPRRKR